MWRVVAPVTTVLVILAALGLTVVVALWCALAALVGGLLFAVSKILPKSDDAP